jgi:SAM-dependent methyltransferase
MGLGLLPRRRRHHKSFYESRNDDPDGPIRALAMPGTHEAVQDAVRRLPRGALLDAGAGEGAFSLWAREQGFHVTAMDSAPEFFQASDVVCQGGNLDEPWPFDSRSFDVVVAIEVIEHVENHYHFLRECCRVVRPGGRIVISTPNCHSLESRWNYMLTGFEDSAPRPIDHRRPDLSMAHINPITFPVLEFGLRACGWEIETISFNRRRRGSRLMAPFLRPAIWWQTYRQLVLRERKPHLRQHNHRLMKTLVSSGLLTGRIAVYTCRQTEEEAPA